MLVHQSHIPLCVHNNFTIRLHHFYYSYFYKLASFNSVRKLGFMKLMFIISASSRIVCKMELTELTGETFSLEEEHLARQAYEAFQNQSYESSLSHLTKLVELRPNDSRVLHNRYRCMVTCTQINISCCYRAVAKYYLSNLTLTDDFRKALNYISQRVSNNDSTM